MLDDGERAPPFGTLTGGDGAAATWMLDDGERACHSEGSGGRGCCPVGA